LCVSSRSRQEQPDTPRPVKEARARAVSLAAQAPLPRGPSSCRSRFDPLLQSQLTKGNRTLSPCRPPAPAGARFARSAAPLFLADRTAPSGWPAAAHMADGVEDGPSCSVCLNPFDSEGRKPWDLGCGHSYCEACLRAHPRSFRTCPGEEQGVLGHAAGGG
jgi:hypothetical protein